MRRSVVYQYALKTIGAIMVASSVGYYLGMNQIDTALFGVGLYFLSLNRV